MKIIFPEIYLTAAISTDYLTVADNKLFEQTHKEPLSRIAKRDTGYFLKLWETEEDARESKLFNALSSGENGVQCLIIQAIMINASCIEFDCDAGYTV